MTVDRERVLAVLRRQREPIEQRYGFRLVGLVGSVARGEAGAESDIDVMAEVTGRASLFSLSRAERDLEQAVGLGMPVELVFGEGMRPSGRKLIERDLVPL